MGKQRKMAGKLSAAMLVVALGVLGLASSASAHTGEWAVFNNCPSTNPTTWKCIHSVTNSGVVKLGNKSVPIVNPVTLEGGYTEEAGEGPEEFVSRFVAATNGQTLSKTPQPVPGGLTGLVNCKEISLGWLRASCEAIFENGLTGVNATLELAKPASEIRISQVFLAFEEGTALQLPVKVHLENPLLGSACYVGSNSNPLIWKLTTGTTSPTPPTKPIKGFGGIATDSEKGLILHLTGSRLVDNTWAAPGANGCGGFLVEYILNPIINGMVGLPAAAGVSEAKLEKVNSEIALAGAVNEH